jgi:hypothetical protein
MNEALQLLAMELIKQAIVVLVPIVVAIIAKMAVDVWAKIKAAKPDLADAIEKAAKFAVSASEQVGLTEEIQKTSKEKLNYAVELAQKYLDAKGLKNVDVSLLVNAVEAAVKDANYPHADEVVRVETSAVTTDTKSGNVVETVSETTKSN